ncbi:MAG: nucleotidyl transferase AbiEii/AbiGii toxin family protein [Planctomycetia bacterium]|nr:nucleotidyl transferase AbiEii/AbiGii toxin family protein [Planctomycetia bacterium]
MQRFSEDIDLTIDPAVFGGRHPDPGMSRSEAQRHLTALGQRCDEFVSGELRDALERDFVSRLGGSDWLIPAPDDPSTLLFAYPTPFGTATG